MTGDAHVIDACLEWTDSRNAALERDFLNA